MSATDMSDMLKGVSSSSSSANQIPSLAATYSRKTTKVTNANQRNGKVTKYARIPFTSSARDDGLSLKHWRRSKSAKGADYEFAKFNHTTRMVVYTDVEYNTLQLDTQQKDDVFQWSRNETDYLLSLCHHFGLRWPVIADRYSYASSSNSSFKKSSSSSSSSSSSISTTPSNSNSIIRNVLDLKHRYYYIARAVLSLRYDRAIKTGPAPARVKLNAPYSVDVLQPGPVEAKLLMAFMYNIKDEQNRIQFLENVFNKTADQEDEEASLKLELKRIELQIKKISDNKDLMLASSKSSSTNILRGHGPVRTAPTNTGTITARGITTNGIKKNPKNSILRNSILHPARMGPLTTDAPVYLRSVRLLAEATPAALRHRNSGITPERVIVPVPTGKMTKKERAAAHIAAQAAADSIIPEVDPSGVTTASIGFKMLNKMRMVLHELGVPSRPIPTRKVCDLYDEIRRDVLTILTAKKKVLPKHINKLKKISIKKEKLIQKVIQKKTKKNNKNNKNNNSGGKLFKNRVAVQKKKPIAAATKAAPKSKTKSSSKKRNASAAELDNSKSIKKTKTKTAAQKKAIAKKKVIVKKEIKKKETSKIIINGAVSAAVMDSSVGTNPDVVSVADSSPNGVSVIGTKKRAHSLAVEGMSGLSPSPKRNKVPSVDVNDIFGDEGDDESNDVDLSNIEPIPFD